MSEVVIVLGPMSMETANKLVAMAEVVWFEANGNGNGELVAKVAPAPSPSRPVRIEQAMNAMAQYLGYPLADLRGHSHRQPLAFDRQCAMYVLRSTMGLSFPSVADAFGGRDHTTAIHGVRKAEGRMRDDREVYERVTGMIEWVRNGG